MIAVFVRMFYQQQIPEAFACNLINYCTNEEMTDHRVLAEVCFRFNLIFRDFQYIFRFDAMGIVDLQTKMSIVYHV